MQLVCLVLGAPIDTLLFPYSAPFVVCENFKIVMAFFFFKFHLFWNVVKENFTRKDNAVAQTKQIHMHVRYSKGD